MFKKKDDGTPRLSLAYPRPEGSLEPRGEILGFSRSEMSWWIFLTASEHVVDSQQHLHSDGSVRFDLLPMLATLFCRSYQLRWSNSQ